MEEEIVAYRHKNITAKHKTTLEITKSRNIGRVADCIIAVQADKGCRDLDEKFKDELKKGKKVQIKIEVDGIVDIVNAYGSSELKMTHPEDIVIRKSNFIDDRTLAIEANKSACDLKKELKEKLKKQGKKINMTLVIEEVFS